MAGRIVNDDVAAVREGARIEDVVREHLALVSAGGGSLKGLCPFHDEKTPSFHVTPSKNLWYCFGCNQGGDVIDFVQRVEQMSFAEAVESLAGRAGVSLRYEPSSGGVGRTSDLNQADRGQRARLVGLNQQAAAFFAAKLQDGEARVAREFMTSRGFDSVAAQQFDVGYAPVGWDLLTKHLRSTGFKDEEIIAAGVGIKGERGVYDRFRNRLVFAVKDARGDVIGFGARKLDDSEEGPKYVNSPETMLYKKSNVLYGLDRARRPIANQREVVVVEGYTDVMACHLAGVTTAVATCGTAFGEGHVKVLRRFLLDSPDLPSAVTFTFDGDAAGVKAALKAFDFEQLFASQTYAAVQPDGLDPCDVRVERSDEALRGLIAARVPLIEFVLKATIGEFDLESADGRVSAARAVAPVLGKVRDRALRDEYLRLISGWLGLEVSQVISLVKSAGATGGASNQSATSPRGLSSSKVLSAPRPSFSKVATPAAVNIEREALKAMIQFPAYVGEFLADVDEELFSAEIPAGIAVAVRDEFVARESGNAGPWVESVQARLATNDMVATFKSLFAEPMQGDVSSPRYCRAVVARLLQNAADRQIEELRGRLKRAEAAGDFTEEGKVFAELLQAENRRRLLSDDAQGAA